jgi:hypothetical protein
MSTQLQKNLKELQLNISRKNLAHIEKLASRSGRTKLSKAFTISIAKYKVALDRLAGE